MPLLKSLLCFKGYDNGRRFLLISLACYLIFIILSPLLERAVVLLIILLVVCTPIMLASSMRRIHDAGFATPLAGGSVAVYWLCVFGITFIDHGASWSLLILSFLITIAMTTISNARVRRNHSYHWGYSGPVDLAVTPEQPANQNFHHQRIEPTIAGAHGEIAGGHSEIAGGHSEIESRRHHSSHTELDTERDVGQINDFSHFQKEGRTNWEQLLSRWFSANKNLSIIISIVISLLVVISLIWLIIDDDEPPQVVEQPAIVDVPKERLNKVEMPDNFWVMLDENDALTIAWQGDYKTDGELWSAISGKGDKDCLEIVFNSRNKFRSMKVSVKNQGDYYADFSPVDTQNIVKAIALRDKFKLCGYEFSLKGTQARLMNNKKYSSYFEN